MQFNVTMPDESFFGVAFGTDMYDVDVIMFRAFGSLGIYEVRDMWSVGSKPPQLEPNEHVTMVKYTLIPGGYVNFEANRPLNTGDPQDYVIPLNKEIPMRWAASFVPLTSYPSFNMTANVG